MGVRPVYAALALCGCVTVDPPPDTDRPPDTDIVDTDARDTDVLDTDVADTDVPPPDLDGDGHVDAAAGGDDCDDTNPAAHPGAVQGCSGIDDDCDGRSFGPAAATWLTSAGREDWTSAMSSSELVDLHADGELLLCEGRFARLSITANVAVFGLGPGTILTGPGTIVSVHGGSADLADLTLRDGVADATVLAPWRMATAGGAVACDEAFVTLSAVIAENNTADAGGALAAASCTVWITDSVLRTNLAGDGGAIAAVDTDLSISATEITENTATNRYGGGVYAMSWDEAPVVTLVDSTIADNAAWSGGGVAFVASSATAATLHLGGSTLRDNAAERYGAGAFLYGNAGIGGLNVTILDTEIAWGLAEDGGGVYAWGALGPIRVAMTGASFLANEARDRGGGLAGADRVDVTCTGDSASEAGFFGNVAPSGAGVWLDGETATLTADACDWGSPADGDDNDGDDVYTDGYPRSWPFEYGADATFTCRDAVCGRLVAADVGGEADDTRAGGIAFGNIYSWDGPATLLEFASNVDYIDPCDTYAAVMSRPTAATGPWTAEYVRAGTAWTAGPGRIEGAPQIALQEDTDYALVTGTYAFGCDLSFFADDTLTETSGFATLSGSWVEPRVGAYVAGDLVPDHSSSTVLGFDQSLLWYEP